MSVGTTYMCATHTFLFYLSLGVYARRSTSFSISSRGARSWLDGVRWISHELYLSLSSSFSASTWYIVIPEPILRSFFLSWSFEVQLSVRRLSLLQVAQLPQLPSPDPGVPVAHCIDTALDLLEEALHGAPH